jgi:toxin YoeB
MKYLITLKKQALKDLEHFKKHNKIISTKINFLLKDLKNDPFNKNSKSEILKFELSGYRSKRISKEHRLIYKIEDNKIIVFSMIFHY